eukprot:TRINITY_DN64653_c0_g1_i1.p1 TRINITY_DN64653_c0_g1~~TRINITY_DN64653_c0_g1_i1.p1  ORF type:complete len:324 (-),score=98.82 TRINITY_DN64653_c0_g1_i1:45-1016(-)
MATSSGGYSEGASPAAASSQTEAGAMRVVVQRCESAELLIDAEKDEWTKVGKGLVLYISFEKGFDSKELPGICKSLLLAPLASSTQWSADHSDADCVINQAKAGIDQALLVIPQASLVCKLERGAKSLKYHKQGSKDEAYRLYRSFLRALRSTAEDLLAGKEVSGAKAETKLSFEELQAQREARAMVDPEDYFKQPDEAGNPAPYSAYDERGVPTHDADGQPITKSGAKKLEKLFAAHLKKWEKAQEKKGEAAGQEAATPASAAEAPAPEALAAAAPAEPEDDGSPLFADLGDGKLVIRHGTFGGRQGFKMTSAGPFTHTFAF